MTENLEKRYGTVGELELPTENEWNVDLDDPCDQEEKSLSAEQKLWHAVYEQAIVSTQKSRSTDGVKAKRAEKRRLAAIRWLTTPSEDLYTICAIVGKDMDAEIAKWKKRFKED